MEDIIPKLDRTLQINKEDVLNIIQNNIHQVTVDKEALLINLKLLVHTDANKEELKEVIQNVCSRLTTNKTKTDNLSEGSPIIDDLANFTRSFLINSTEDLLIDKEVDNAFDVDLLEIICILYLKSIHFNFPFFIKKTRINEKHNMKVTIYREVRHYESNALSRLTTNFIKNYDKDINIAYLRIFITNCLLNDNPILLPSSILYFINYLIRFDPLIIVDWIKYKPKYYPSNILNISIDFPFTELKYIKTMKLLTKIKSNTINLKFIHYIIKQTNFSEEFYRLIVMSHDKKYSDSTLLICKMINKIEPEVNIELIKRLMIVDKTSFNEYFIEMISSDQQNLTFNLLEIFVVNYKLLGLCNTKIVSDILYNNNLIKIIDNYKVFKYFLNILADRNMLDMDLLSRIITDSRMISHIYKNYKVETRYFYDQVIKIIKKLIKEHKEIYKNNKKWDKNNIKWDNNNNKNQDNNINQSTNYINQSTNTNQDDNDNINQSINTNQDDNNNKNQDNNNKKWDNNTNQDDNNINQSTNTNRSNCNRSCFIDNLSCYIDNTIPNCDSTIRDISLLETDFSIFNIKDKGSCKCFKKKIKLVVKLLFVFNSPDIPKKLIYKLYLMNKKHFIKYFTRFTEYNTLYIKIHKLIPEIRKDLIFEYKDYWIKASLYKINKKDIPEDGLYFNKSFIKFENESKTFTSNLSFTQCVKDGNQILIKLINNKDTFIIGIRDGNLYTESFINNIRNFKENSCDSNNIYLELMYSKKRLSLVIENRKYKFDIFDIKDIVIGEGFKGFMTKMLYFEGENNKSRILHLNKSELYVKVIRNIEMWCISRSLEGFFISSKKVYWWHKKKEVQFYNIIEIN